MAPAQKGRGQVQQGEGTADLLRPLGAWLSHKEVTEEEEDEEEEGEEDEEEEEEKSKMISEGDE